MENNTKNSISKSITSKLSLKDKKDIFKKQKKEKKENDGGFLGFLRKLPTAYTILFFVLFFIMFLTWVIPGTMDIATAYPEFYSPIGEGYLDPDGKPIGPVIDSSWTLSQTVDFLRDSNELNTAYDPWLAGQIESMYGVTFETSYLVNGGEDVKDVAFVVSESTTIGELTNLFSGLLPDGTQVQGAFDGDDWTASIEVTLVYSATQINPQGLLNVLYSVVYGFADALPVILFIFVLGAFIELTMESGAMEKATASFLGKTKGKEIFIIPLLFVIFSLGGTTYGMQEETLGFFLVIVPIVIMAGFDAVTGMIIIVLGTTTGIAASTVNPFSIGAAVSAIDSAEVTLGTGIGFRWVYWVVFTGFGAAYVTWYAKRVQKDPSKSVLSEADREEQMIWAKSQVNENPDKLTGKEKGILWIFGLSFLVMIFFIMPWYEWVPEMAQVPQNGWHWYSWIAGSTPTTGDYPYIALGGPGSWYFNEIIVMFMLSTLLIGLLNWQGEKHFFETCWSGVKSMVSVAMVIAIARGVPMLLNWSGVDTFIITGLASAAQGLGALGYVVVAYFIFTLLSFLIPSTSGLAGATMGIMGTPDVTHSAYNSVATINAYSVAIGSVNMISPAQGILMAQSEASHVKYVDYLKVAMPYFGFIWIMGIPVAMLSTVATF